ncbi:MAG: ABC transporter ATP-binding protein [Actinobacteria bacterium]|nr:ABC transporter ATP-binding protein [Actinomycetota bacterium]
MTATSLGRCSRCHQQLLTDGTCRVCRHRFAAATAPPAATVAHAAPRERLLEPAPPLRVPADRALDQVHRRPPSSGGRREKRPDTPRALSVQGLTKVYGDGGLRVTAVQDVTFEVDEGEIVMIMGPSGSGKTTLLLMLGAMLRPTSGRVVIGGTDVGPTPERKLPSLRASHLGFVFQDFNLLSALSALENVEIACNLAGVRGEPAAARACYLLDRVGLWRRLNACPDQLSGGEKQRVAVARALANDPPLLLADEPTANLDSVNGKEIGELLRRLSDEDGRTSLIVTHDDRLAAIADRVLWLQDGRLSAKRRR